MKRSYRTGTITQRGSSWRLRYYVNGRRYTKTMQGTKAAAERELRRLLATADEGQHIAPNKITFKQWAVEWLALKSRSLAGQTYDRYDGLLTKHVLPVLGRRRLQQVTARDIDALYGKLPLAASTKQFLHTITKSCFASAVRKKLIPTNPFDAAEKLPNPEDDVGTVLDEAQLGCAARQSR